MVGMFIYLDWSLFLGILIKLIMLAEWNIQKYICLNVYISKDNVSWGFILIFSNQFKYDRILLNFSQEHRGLQNQIYAIISCFLY